MIGRDGSGIAPRVVYYERMVTMTMGRSGIRVRVIFLGEVDLARSLGGRKAIFGVDLEGEWNKN